MTPPETQLISPSAPSAAGAPLAGARAVVRPAPPSASAAAQRRALAAEIQSYADLPPDWDCDGGRAPARTDIDNAVAFLQSLPGGDLPRPMVAGDGDVGFTWRTPDAYLEVGFCDRGQISFYGKAPDGEKEWGDHNYAREGVPDNLWKLLERIAHVPRGV